MLDFSNFLDLPLIWGMLIAVVIFLYVLLDGFDLGVGILFPFAPSDKCRDRMMNSIAPFWDGNETWLVLGGGSLFVAFPLAYGILMSAFYIPIFAMLFGLILRGVALEFRFKAENTKAKFLWESVFHIGSLVAAFSQGVILGAFVQGVQTHGRHFAGHPFDWATGFSMLTGIALVFGYALLGSTWLIMKTDEITQIWARKAASYTLAFVGVFMIMVSICVPFLNPLIRDFWFSFPNFFLLLPIPIFTAILYLLIWRDLYNKKHEVRPFFYSIGVFLMGYLGLGLSLFPWIIPFKYNLWQAAANGPSLTLMLIGVLPLLPIILSYTAYCYYVFRGKSGHEGYY